MQIARDCIEAGLHVLLEKPPTATLAEIDDLRDRAARRGVSLFTTWHAQHNPAVVDAAALLAGRRVRDMAIIWHEDVEKWHPGQRWIWQAGGFGVFDPGINAFSIAVENLPGQPVRAHRGAVISGRKRTPRSRPRSSSTARPVTGSLRCSLDWRRSAGEEWTISIVAEDGPAITLLDGGARLVVDGEPRPTGAKAEYPDIYRRFAELVDRGESEVDSVPLRLVADCLLVGSRHIVD